MNNKWAHDDDRDDDDDHDDCYGGRQYGGI